MTDCGSSLALMRNISGYGRELFVSNVIRFVGDYYPHIFKRIFFNNLPDGFKVGREWKHTDISVFTEGKAKPVIIIENKIGAAINDAQLEKYSHLVDDGGQLILLSLRKPPHLIGKWQYLGYGELVERMLPALVGQGFEMDFLRYFCEYLQSLHNEIESIDKDLDENIDTRTLKDITANNEMRPYMARAIFEALSLRIEDRLRGCPVRVNAGFTHSPMIEVNFNKDEESGMEYVIQVQDNHLIIGFVIDNNGKYKKPEGVDSDRTEKQKNRAAIWDEYAPEPLRKFVGNRNITGYTTERYIMPTVRLNRADVSIGQLINEIAELVNNLESSIINQSN